MKIIETLFHPNESFLKKIFLRLSFIFFILYPIINLSPTVKEIIYLSPLNTPLILNLSAVLLINFVVFIALYNQAIQKNKTGFLSLLIGQSLLVLLFLFFHQISHAINPLVATPLSTHIFYPFNSIFQTILISAWIYFALKIRKINLQHLVRREIELSPEAFALLNRLENPENKETIDEFFAFVTKRLPPSYMKLLKPLEAEAFRRLPPLS